jgi:glycosyltransferase involved in cell wall biosynthesis
VDDASPGGTVLDLPADPSIRIVHRDVNGGVSAAQNTGLRAATGTSVCFLHSDDVMLPEKLALQVPALDDGGDDLGAVESATVRDRGGLSREVGPRLRGYSADDVLARKAQNVHISPFLFRRDALVSLGGFDEDLRAYEDFDLLVRLRQRFDVAFIDEPTVVVRQHGDDRLADSPWMQAGREMLISKYREELRRFDPLPTRWQEWEVGAGLAALDRGDPTGAREHFRASVRGDRWARARRVPLLAATWGPPRVGRAVAAGYGSGSRALRRRSPR